MLKTQASALCWVGKKIILVKAGKKYSLPTGLVLADDESPLRRAEQEAWEQAGVLGVAEKPRIGEFLSSAKGTIYKVEVFRLRKIKLRENWPLRDSVKRELFDPADAIQAVDEFGLRDILAKLSRHPQ